MTSSIPERFIPLPKEGFPKLVFENIFSPVPLNAGDKLLTLPAAEANQDMRFYFAIGVHEPGIAEGTPLVMLVEFLSRAVEVVTQKLSPFLLR
jgi:hypothetical protein